MVRKLLRFKVIVATSALWLVVVGVYKFSLETHPELPVSPVRFDCDHNCEHALLQFLTP